MFKENVPGATKAHNGDLTKPEKTFQEQLLLCGLKALTEVSRAVGRTHHTWRILRREYVASEEEVSEKPGETSRGQFKQAISKEQRFQIGHDVIQLGFQWSLELQRVDWKEKVEMKRPVRWLLQYSR